MCVPAAALPTLAAAVTAVLLTNRSVTYRYYHGVTCVILRCTRRAASFRRRATSPLYRNLDMNVSSYNLTHHAMPAALCNARLCYHHLLQRPHHYHAAAPTLPHYLPFTTACLPSSHLHNASALPLLPSTAACCYTCLSRLLHLFLPRCRAFILAATLAHYLYAPASLYILAYIIWPLPHAHTAFGLYLKPPTRLTPLPR